MKTTSGEECYALLDDRAHVNTGVGYTFYTVKSNKPVQSTMGIQWPEEVSIADAELSCCTTAEGVNLSILRNGSEQEAVVVEKFNLNCLKSQA